MKPSNPYFRALIVVAAIAPSAIGSAFAQSASPEESAGKQALQNRDYVEAGANFKIGLLNAQERDDPESQARFYFFLGLTEQAGAEAGESDREFDRAAAYYQRALKLAPASGSTMVNLARVLGSLGRLGEAEKLYRRAIKLGDERRTAYMANYAEFFEDSGRAEQAISVYRRLVALDRQNVAAQEALAAYYLDPAREWRDLERYLWELLRASDADRAIDGALESLGNRTAPEERESLLTVIAAGLSRRSVAPASFVESSRAEFLWGFSEDPSIGDGVRQLFAVYGVLLEDESEKWQEGNPYDGMDFSWWQRGDPWEDPDIGLYPRDAFRLLMRSLGDRYARRKKNRIAEDCYETAATFTSDEIDPAAIRDLVDLYGRTGEVGKIEELAGRFEFSLFEAKGEAYRKSQLEKIYEYHQTLGQIYGYLAQKTGDWGSSTKPNSAIFQLERAYSAGQRLDEAANPAAQVLDDPTETVVVLQGTRGLEYRIDPGLVQRLAQAYEATGDKDRADDLRLQSAERYEVAGNERAKIYVLQPVEEEKLAPVQKQRYERLVAPKVLDVKPELERRIDPRTKTAIERRDGSDGQEP